jgi:nitrate reductase NapD
MQVPGPRLTVATRIRAASTHRQSVGAARQVGSPDTSRCSHDTAREELPRIRAPFQRMAASTAPFHVAGVLVQALPGCADAVRRRIARLPGAVIHATDPAGRLVVTLESDAPAELAAQFTRMQVLPGVLSAVLVAEHSDDPAMPRSGDS